MAQQPTQTEFAEFLQRHGPGLRHAFIARYGPDVGSDVMSDVTEYAWQNWTKLARIENQSGWLYRVGQSRSRRYFRRPARLPGPRPDNDLRIEPGLPAAIESLSNARRVAVLLVHAFGYRVRDAAAILGVSPSTVQQNAQRGLAELRATMGVTSDA